MAVPVLAQVKNDSQAPDFTLTDINGKTHSLSDFKGSTVVLEWYNRHCPFVKKFYESGEMQRLQKLYTEKDVVWLSIVSSAQGKQGNKSNDEHMADRKGFGIDQIPLLVDADGKVGKMYGAKTTPHMYVINKEGVLVYQGAIDSINSTDSDDIKKAENYVVAALESLMKGESIVTPTSVPYGCSVKY